MLSTTASTNALILPLVINIVYVTQFPTSIIYS